LLTPSAIAQGRPQRNGKLSHIYEVQKVSISFISEKYRAHSVTKRKIADLCYTQQ